LKQLLVLFTFHVLLSVKSAHHMSSSASVKIDSDKATIGDPSSPPNTSGKGKD